jgi:hypothetical protein
VQLRRGLPSDRGYNTPGWPDAAKSIVTEANQMQRRKLRELEVVAIGLGGARMKPLYGDPEPARRSSPYNLRPNSVSTCSTPPTRMVIAAGGIDCAHPQGAPRQIRGCHDIRKYRV